MPRRPHPYAVNLAAVVAVSWAAPLIRLAQAPSLAIAAWRLTFSALLLLPLFVQSRPRGDWARLGSSEGWIALVAGVALALHFATWITSLRLTSVAASSVLVSLSPVFAWFFSRAFLKVSGPQRAKPSASFSPSSVPPSSLWATLARVAAPA